MIKNNKCKLLISSIIILLPIVFGLIVWDALPEQMTTHWGINGNADGWSNRYVGVFAFPIILLIIHWFCIFCTTLDPKNKEQNNKVFSMVIWITPIISVFANGIIYAVSFGKVISSYLIANLLIGATFVIIGNYLPKCKQNYTIGIRISWTLENEENWNATHRFSGKIWFIGGLLIMLSALLPNIIMFWTMISLTSLIVIIPFIYSYLYHKKQIKEGKADFITKSKNKVVIIVNLIITSIVLAFVGVIMFSGDINVKYDEKTFTLEASYWNDITIKYDEIETIEYRNNDNKGMRTNGFGSARLLIGAFNNDEFGNYTRYSYTNCDACVVLKKGDEVLVISGVNVESTNEIYENIKLKIK